MHTIKHQRFIREGCDNILYISLSLSGNIAVTSFSTKNGRTFIDLFCESNPSYKDTWELYYSKEFDSYPGGIRTTSFLENDDYKIVTCVGNKIERIDTKDESKVLQPRILNDSRPILCLAVRAGDIFIGLKGSQTVLVFDSDLRQTKTITLIGMENGEYPCDLDVIKDVLLLRTSNRRALSIREIDGRILADYRDSIHSDRIFPGPNASSVAASEKLGLVVVVWNGSEIIVYPLNENRSILSFYVANDVNRIRISDKDGMLVAALCKTSEIKMYDLEQMFAFDAMKEGLKSLTMNGDCAKILSLFAVSKDLTDLILKDDRQTPTFGMYIVDEGKKFGDNVDIFNVNQFTDALLKTIPSLHKLVDRYKKILPYAEWAKRLKTKEKAWENERQQLKKIIKERETEMDVLRAELEKIKAEMTEYAEKIAQIEQGASEHATEQKTDNTFSSLKLRDTRGPETLDVTRFGNFQFHLSSHLTRDIIRNLTLVFDFSPAESEGVENDNIKFIRLLKGKGLISSEDISRLIRALREIDQHGVADKAESLFQKYTC